MKTLALLAVLAIQDSAALDFPEYRDGSPHTLITLKLVDRDGESVKGRIRCEGYWYQFADEPDQEIAQDAPWFGTDSRGAVIFRNVIADDVMVCQGAGRDGGAGAVTVNLDWRGSIVQEIVLR